MRLHIAGGQYGLDSTAIVGTAGPLYVPGFLHRIVVLVVLRGSKKEMQVMKVSHQFYHILLVKESLDNPRFKG